jgi:hypothetical protein
MANDTNILMHPKFIKTSDNLAPLFSAGAIEEQDKFYDNPKNYKTDFDEPLSKDTVLGKLTLDEKKMFHEICELSGELHRLHNKLLKEAQSTNPMHGILLDFLGMKKQDTDKKPDASTLRLLIKRNIRRDYLKAALHYNISERLDVYTHGRWYVGKEFVIVHRPVDDE